MLDILKMMETYNEMFNLQTDKKAYKKFVEAVQAAGYTMEEIKKWSYAGGFHRDLVDTGVNLAEDSRLRAIWRLVMGPDAQIPDDQPSKECICGEKIDWNHIIVDNPEAEEPEFLIIGSVCVTCYSNGGNGLKVIRNCELCNAEHRNRKTDRCNSCKNIRFCERGGCSNQMPKGKRGIYCKKSCEYPDVFCSKCEGKLTRSKYGNKRYCVPCWKKSKGY